jgi:lipoyl(octanoyl) transferase
MSTPRVHIQRLGRLAYDDAYAIQTRTHDRILASRATPDPAIATLLLVEHDPVITVTKRKDAPAHVVTPAHVLEQLGIQRRDTDRGGDVTYHGPGQLVVYPIVDLNALRLKLHDYVRLLEQSIIGTLAQWDIRAQRDPGATGVWVEHDNHLAKIAAIGIRVRKWITLHGLAVNVDPDMSHFTHIVPCGLAGRPVVSIKQILGDDTPTLDTFADALSATLADRLTAQYETRTGVPH